MAPSVSLARTCDPPEQAVIDRLLERRRAKREEDEAAARGMAGQLELGQQQGQQREQRQQRRQGQGEEELSFDELVALAQPTDLGEGNAAAAAAMS